MSAPFRFPLEKVLELRLEEEQRQARMVADARRDATAAREAVEHLEALRSTSRDRIRRAHVSGRSVGQIQNLEWMLERMEGEIREAESRARDADSVVSRCLEEFQRAVRDRQTLDRLRDRRRGEWEKDERDRDRKEMDEVALSRFVRAEGRTRNEKEAS